MSPCHIGGGVSGREGEGEMGGGGEKGGEAEEGKGERGDLSTKTWGFHCSKKWELLK